MPPESQAWFTRRTLAAVPLSVFCAGPDLGRALVRFAVCKRDEVLTEAASTPAKLGQTLRETRERQQAHWMGARGCCDSDSPYGCLRAPNDDQPLDVA